MLDNLSNSSKTAWLLLFLEDVSTDIDKKIVFANEIVSPEHRMLFALALAIEHNGHLSRIYRRLGPPLSRKELLLELL